MSSLALQYGVPIDAVKRNLALAVPELGQMVDECLTKA